MTRLTATIKEVSIHASLVKRVKEELDKNYEPIEKFMREGGEYFEKPMIQVKADGEVITPKALYEYLKFKYKVGEEFTKQIVRDWMYGGINNDFHLSKNVQVS